MTKQTDDGSPADPIQPARLNTSDKALLWAALISGGLGLLSAVVPAVLDAFWPSTPVYAGAGFGEWIEHDPDHTYPAGSDGFVVAVGRGDDPGRGSIYEGSQPGQASMTLRARFPEGYRSATLPVAKGRYWRVQSERGEVKVYWLSVQPVEPNTAPDP